MMQGAHVCVCFCGGGQKDVVDVDGRNIKDRGVGAAAEVGVKREQGERSLSGGWIDRRGRAGTSRHLEGGSES